MHASLFDKMEQCMTEYIFKFLRSCQAARSSEIVLLSQFHNNSKLLEETKIFTVTWKLKLLVPHVFFFIDKGIPVQIFCDFQPLF